MDDARAVRRRYVVCSDNAPPTDLFPGFDGGIVVEALISNPHEFTTEICAHECGVFRIMTKNCSQPRRGEQISFALQFDNRVLHARVDCKRDVTGSVHGVVVQTSALTPSSPSDVNENLTKTVSSVTLL